MTQTTSTDLDPLGQHLVAGVGVSLVQHQADAGGAGQGEVGAGTLHGGVGELQLSAQLQTRHLGQQAAAAQLQLLAVVRDHLLLVLPLVVQDEELGSAA